MTRLHTLSLQTGLLLLGLAGADLQAAPQSSPIEASAPIKRFTLPVFTQEGYRSMHVKGDEATMAGANHIDVNGMVLSLFSGKADNRLETVLTSTRASFFPQDKRANGDEGVRIVRDDVDMAGTRWNYDHTAKKVVIDGNVRVIFTAHLDDILK